MAKKKVLKKANKNLSKYIILSAVLMLGFFFFWKFSHSPKNYSNTDTNNAQVLSPNEASDWNTYSNTAIGYELKYPSNFKTPYTASGNNAPNTDGTESGGFIFFSREKPQLSYLLDVHPYTGSLEDFYEEFKKSATATNDFGEYSNSVEIDRSVLINKVSGLLVRVISKNKKSGVETVTSNEILLVNKGHSFTFSPYSSQHSPDEAGIMMQIISTLKFTTN